MPAQAMEGQVAKGYWMFHVSIGDAETYNATDIGLDVSYDCRGTGTHDFRAVADATVNYSGLLYRASDADGLGTLNC